MDAAAAVRVQRLWGEVVGGLRDALEIQSGRAEEQWGTRSAPAVWHMSVKAPSLCSACTPSLVAMAKIPYLKLGQLGVLE